METDQLVEYLQKNITDKMPLEDIVNIFEKMCQIPMEDDMILFETGTYDFTGEPLFYFSMARQLPNEEEEFVQIHVDVQYKPTKQNRAFQSTVWNEDLDGNIFDYIRNSSDFAWTKDQEYLQTEIYMDET